MKAKYIVIFFLSLLSFVACDKEEVIIPTTAPPTVLIYFAGDNSLRIREPKPEGDKGRD